MRFGVFISFLFLSLSLFALSPLEKQRVKERIKPIGQVRLAKQETATTPTVGSARSSAGKLTFEKYCSVCHQDGIAGAPKFRNAADWKPRLDKNTIDQLLAVANKGLNAMPVKGTCTECTDEDLKNAIQYMLPQP
jgi:cytochrome c5